MARVALKSPFNINSFTLLQICPRHHGASELVWSGPFCSALSRRCSPVINNRPPKGRDMCASHFGVWAVTVLILKTYRTMSLTWTGSGGYTLNWDVKEMIQMPAKQRFRLLTFKFCEIQVARSGCQSDPLRYREVLHFTPEYQMDDWFNRGACQRYVLMGEIAQQFEKCAKRAPSRWAII